MKVNPPPPPMLHNSVGTYICLAEYSSKGWHVQDRATFQRGFQHKKNMGLRDQEHLSQGRVADGKQRIRLNRFQKECTEVPDNIPTFAKP